MKGISQKNDYMCRLLCARTGGSRRRWSELRIRDSRSSGVSKRLVSQKMV